MNQRLHPAQSYLFTVRLWWEDLGEGQSEWRGVVKLVADGEEHFFRDWGTLGRLMAGLLPPVESMLVADQEQADS